MNHDRRTAPSSRGQFARRSRIPVLLAALGAVSLTLTGCAAQSIATVTDLVDAARVGDTRAIERLTTDDFPQEDLAVVATYVLEGCDWKSAEASGDEVRGRFSCAPGSPVASRELVFAFEGAKVESVQESSR